MKHDTQRIIEEALQLEPTTRAYVAEALLESLDYEEDFPVSPAWREEIHKRCVQIDTQAVQLIVGPAAMEELRKRIL